MRSQGHASRPYAVRPTTGQIYARPPAENIVRQRGILCVSSSARLMRWSRHVRKVNPGVLNIYRAKVRRPDDRWRNLTAMYAMKSEIVGSNPFTSGFLSIVHSSGIEFLLRRRIHGLSP
ncbi:hypothetical protein RGR602_PA00024 (plasmid) [Rhizobium gallicum bv. gallicum R602sp]|uniref:Uncharacterized protein n=1 Tax=Rhizobium gallicum bv. gallicum R602sp TaxID=1041138 RepID=A0A0B4X856_9HYPH|nr:hypothetical protein RGR602_PA00024 [Rhizobium gallicum bv. gallicum R602sp]